MDYDAIYQDVTKPKGKAKQIDYDALYNQVTAPKNKEVTNASSRFFQGLKDPLDGAAQLLEHVLPNGASKAINSANNYIADKTGLVAKLPSNGMDGYIDQQNKNYAPPDGVDWARLGGNILSPANLALASKIPQGASLGGRVLSGVTTGAGLGAISPTKANGDFVQDKTNQVMLSAVFGGVLPIATGAASRIVSPKASTNPQLQFLRENGVTPTIGQSLGGVANKIEEKLGSYPIIGDGIASARNKSNQQFETSVYNKALEPIGAKLPKGLTGRDAVNYTESTLKNRYDSVLSGIGAIKQDQTFKQNVSQLESMVNKLMIPKADKAKFTTALNEVKQTADENGYITSDAFKTLESSLGSDARKLGISQNIYDSRLAPAVKQLQSELRDMLKRQAGDKADELQKSNAAYAGFKRVQNAASRIGAEDGSFTPAQFQSAVRAMDKSKDKGAFARGDALMQDFGDAGKSVLGDKVPNSGSADRLLTGAGLYSFFDPMVGLPLLAGASMYTKPMQKLLAGSVVNRPQSAQAVGKAIKNSSPYLLPSGLSLLNYMQN